MNSPTIGKPQQPTSDKHHLIHNGMHHPVPPHPSEKQQITVSLPTALIERLRNAVYWTEQPSLASLIAEALDNIVTEMEEVNNGPFPPRLSPLKRGRRQGKRSPVLTSLPPCQPEPERHGSLKKEEEIRKDMHDSILQSLFAIGLHLDASKSTKHLRNGTTNDALLNQTIGRLNCVIQKIRLLIQPT